MVMVDSTPVTACTGTPAIASLRHKSRVHRVSGNAGFHRRNLEIPVPGTGYDFYSACASAVPLDCQPLADDT